MTNKELYLFPIDNIKTKTQELENAIREFKEGYQSQGISNMEDLTVGEEMMVSDRKQTIAHLSHKYNWPF